MTLSTILWAAFLVPFVLTLAFAIISGWALAMQHGGLAGLLLYWPGVYGVYAFVIFPLTHLAVLGTAKGYHCGSGNMPDWLETFGAAACPILLLAGK